VVVVAEVLEPARDLRLVVDEVAQEDDQPPAGDALGDVVQHGADVGVVVDEGVLEQFEDAAKLALAGLGRQVVAELGVEEPHADGVVLVDQEVGQGGGQVAGVGQLAQPVRGEGHRPRGVQQQVGAQVGLVLEELDVVLVGAGGDLPVEVAQVVAGGVGAVVEVLDGEPVVGAAVPAGQEALDDLPGHQLQLADAGEPLGVKVTLAHRQSLSRSVAQSLSPEAPSRTVVDPSTGRLRD
jgi:hypothetical protein